MPGIRGAWVAWGRRGVYGVCDVLAFKLYAKLVHASQQALGCEGKGGGKCRAPKIDALSAREVITA